LNFRIGESSEKNFIGRLYLVAKGNETDIEYRILAGAANEVLEVAKHKKIHKRVGLAWTWLD
jgi:hypothetical protein